MKSTDSKLCMERLVAGQGELRAFIASLLPYNPSDALDVVSETNRALIEHAAEYDASRPFRPWMFTFARNQVLAFRKKCARSRLIFDDALARAAAESYDHQFPPDDSEASLLAALETCKDRLPPQHRELIDRRYVQKQSVDAIARERRANPHTVTTLLAYIRDRLAACVKSVCRLSAMDPAPVNVPSETQRTGAILEGLAVESETFLDDLRSSPRLLDEWILQHRLDALLALDASLAYPPATASAVQVRHPVRRRWLRAAVLLAVSCGLGLVLFAAAVITSVSRSASTVPVQSQITNPQLPICKEEPAMNLHTLTNTLATAVTLAVATPANATDWTYYAAGAAGNPTNVACIADGTWILKASLSGTSLAVRGSVSGSGAMDLSKPVNGGAYSITEVGPANNDIPFNGVAITVLTFPSTLQRLPINALRGSGVCEIFGNTTNLVEIGQTAFFSCTSLTNVAILMSAVTNLAEKAFSGGSPLSATDVTVWQGFPAVKSIGLEAFYGCKMTGRLVLSSVRTIGVSAFRETNLGELVIDSPYLMQVPQNICYGAKSLTNLVLRTPALTNIAETTFSGNVPLSMTDVTGWELPAVTAIGKEAFNGCQLTGTLSLPSLSSLGLSTIRGTKISRLELGAEASGPITIGQDCFYGDSFLKSILFAGTNTITLGGTGSNHFGGGVSVTNVTFEGPAPASSVLDVILNGVAANASTHACAIYVSKRQAGWTDLATPVNTAEAASWQTAWATFTADHDSLLGVYTNSVGRKAWIIHQKSPADGHGGFVIRICENDGTVTDLDFQQPRGDVPSSSCSVLIRDAPPASSFCGVSHLILELSRRYCLGRPPCQKRAKWVC